MNGNNDDRTSWFRNSEFETAILEDGILLIDRIYNVAHVLSPDLSYIWRSLQGGLSPEEMILEISEAFSATKEDATRRCFDLLDHLEAFFLSRHSANQKQESPALGITLGTGSERVSFSMLGKGIDFIFSDAQDAAYVRTQLAGYFTGPVDATTECYVIRLADRILLSHEPSGALHMADPRRLLVAVHTLIQRNYARLGDYSLSVHAAAVEFNGKVIILAGSSGFGKTTLAATLCAQGGRLICEDTLFVSNDGLYFLPSSPLVRIRSFVREYVASLHPELLKADEVMGKDGFSFSFFPLVTAKSMVPAENIQLLILEGSAKADSPLVVSRIENPSQTLSLLVGSGCLISRTAKVEDIANTLILLAFAPSISVKSWTFESLSELVRDLS